MSLLRIPAAPSSTPYIEGAPPMAPGAPWAILRPFPRLPPPITRGQVCTDLSHRVCHHSPSPSRSIALISPRLNPNGPTPEPNRLSHLPVGAAKTSVGLSNDRIVAVFRCFLQRLQSHRHGPVALTWEHREAWEMCIPRHAWPYNGHPDKPTRALTLCQTLVNHDTASFCRFSVRCV